MPQLEDLDKDEDHHHVHHGSVELQRDVRRTDVEDGTKKPLHVI